MRGSAEVEGAQLLEIKDVEGGLDAALEAVVKADAGLWTFERCDGLSYLCEHTHLYRGGNWRIELL